MNIVYDPVFKFRKKTLFQFGVIAFFILFLFWPFYTGYGENAPTPEDPADSTDAFDIYAWNEEVEAKMEAMTLEEKIGQLFMVAAYSERGEGHYQYLEDLVEKYHIGGVIFFQGGPERQAALAERLQHAADIPLLTGSDAEWGLGMRLDSSLSFPYQMSLGAIQNDSLIYEMGKKIGKQLLRTGVHVNFAPVVDVNNNPDNPVIGMRAFGEDKEWVARKSLAYMRGLQDAGVIAVAKHFPGHGDTDKDSHYELPVINHDRDRLENTELFPFRKMFKAGVGGVMSAHLHIPALDDGENLPASLSYPVTTKLLQEEMGFDGLIFTDALNMKAVSNYYEPEVAGLKAFKAGNDVLLFPENVPATFNRIKAAVEAGELSEERLNRSVRKILAAKEWVRSHEPSEKEVNDNGSIVDYINNSEAKLLNKRLIENTMTVVNDPDEMLPLRNLRDEKIAVVSLGTNAGTHFQRMSMKYWPVDVFTLSRNPSAAESQELLKQLENGYDKVITTIHNIPAFGPRAGNISSRLLFVQEAIEQEFPVIRVLFGNPYALRHFEASIPTLVAWKDDSLYQHTAAEVVFGARHASGRMPVSIEPHIGLGDGRNTLGDLRLRYTIPEETGMDPGSLGKIDSIVQQSIKDMGTPGAQVLVVHKGNVVYERAFGYHTYERVNRVANDDLYDLASVTKIAATTLAAMRFYEVGRWHPDSTIGQYVPGIDNEEKRNIRIRDLLAHQAGLRSWIPFYQLTLEEHGLCDFTFCYEPSHYFDVKVAENLYVSSERQPEVIWDTIHSSPLLDEKRYNYSDLGMFYMKKMIDNFTRVPFEDFLQEEFYTPLGMSTMGFNPRDRFPLFRIPPTEYDMSFRRQLVHGHVHDPAAAMMGGVAGNAGLFSNANDLAILMQMLMNGGEYGGVHYLAGETIDYFTSQQFEDNRRGLGFDKPEPDKDKQSPVPGRASPQTFGHLGFTGTSVWADPEHDIIFVLLANRVHPNQTNNVFSRNKVRTKSFDAVYDALGIDKD